MHITVDLSLNIVDCVKYLNTLCLCILHFFCYLASFFKLNAENILLQTVKDILALTEQPYWSKDEPNLTCRPQWH